MCRVQAHARDQQAAGAQEGGQLPDDGRFRAGGQQRDDVPGGEHQVVARIQAESVQAGQVAEDPLLRGGLAAGDGEHRGVDVHAGAGVAQFGQPDRDPPGAASGVEHPGGGLQQCGAERGLAVDVVARLGEPRETLGVFLSRLSSGQFRPAVALPSHVPHAFRSASPLRGETKRSRVAPSWVHTAQSAPKIRSAGRWCSPGGPVSCSGTGDAMGPPGDR